MSQSSSREYRSSAFSLLYQEPKYALELYNRLNGTAYTDPSRVRIHVLENGIRLSVRNDASFLIGSVLSIYEAQSTFNPNMPLRMLDYVTRLFREYIGRKRYRKAIYGSERLMLPEPRFAVFYTGPGAKHPVETMHLSDSYEGRGELQDVQLELVCTVYNLDTPESRAAFEGTKSLSGYMIFLDKVKEFRGPVYSEEANRRAVAQVIDYCIREGILPEFFREKRGEIMDSMILDLTYEHQLEEVREANAYILREELKKKLKKERAKARKEGRAEGREEGRAEGTIDTLVSLVQKGLLTVENAAEQAGMEKADFQRKMNQ